MQFTKDTEVLYLSLDTNSIRKKGCETVRQEVIYNFPFVRRLYKKQSRHNEGQGSIPGQSVSGH